MDYLELVELLDLLSEFFQRSVVKIIRNWKSRDSTVKKVLQLVKSNSGILTFDNYCHYYGSPTPSTRPVNYLAANYTVVAISEYQFLERPSFVWRYLENIDTVVTSIPLDPKALLPVHDQVHLSPFFFLFFFFFSHDICL